MFTAPHVTVETSDVERAGDGKVFGVVAKEFSAAAGLTFT